MSNNSAITFLCFFFFCFSVNIKAETFEFERGGKIEVYSSDHQKGSLEIQIGGELQRFDNVLGAKGGTFRGLTEFNGNPSLFYETTASSTPFTVFYLLKVDNHVPVIDCLYSEIRNAQNGATIRNAVCNLEMPLAPDYHELVYRYSDTWINETNSADFAPVMAQPPTPVDVLSGCANTVKVISRYSSVDDLVSSTPETWVIQGAKSHSLGKGNVYSVFDKDGLTFLGLDIEKSESENDFSRLTLEDIQVLMETNQ